MLAVQSYFFVDAIALKAWRNHRRGLVIGGLVWLVFYLSPLLSGWAMASAIDYRSGGSNTFLFPFVYVTVELVTVLLLWRGNIVYEGAQRATEFDLREATASFSFRALWRHRHGRGLAPGELVVRLRQDSPELVMVADCWIDFIGVTIYSLVALGVIGSVSIRAMWLSFVCWLLFFGGSLWCSNKVGQAFRAEREASDSLGERLLLIGRRFTSLMFGRMISDQIEHYSRELTVRSKRARNTSSLTAVMTDFNAAFGGICTGVVLCAVAGTGLTGSEIILLVAYLGRISQLPQKIGNLVAARKRGSVALSRIHDIESIDSHDINRPVDQLCGQVVAVVKEIVSLERNPQGAVYFSYVTSTETDLVSQIWDMLLQEMEAGGLPRGSVSLVRSSSAVYSGSVRDNLGGVNDDVGHFALSRVELGGGGTDSHVWLERRLAAEGVDLSGGERQRLIVARAIASHAKVVIIDERIAGIPVEQEKRIYDSCSAAGCIPLVLSGSSNNAI